MIYLHLKYQFQQIVILVVELSCVDLYTPQKEFYFMVVPYMSALARLNVLTKLQLSCVIEKKEDSCILPSC